MLTAALLTLLPLAATPNAEGVVAFVGVDVAPMDAERVLPDQTVLVRDGVIAAVGPSSDVRVPEGARVVEGAGRTLLPGFAEMHGHLPYPGSAMKAEDTLFLYVANGVTLVRGMQGDATQLELRARIAAGDLVGPRLLVSSPAMSGQWFPNPTRAREAVEGFAAEGFDHIKVHEALSPESYDAICAAASAADLRWAGHVSDLVGLEHALAAGQDTVDHLDNMVDWLVDGEGEDARPNLERLPALVRLLRESGAGVVPTLRLWEAFHSGISGDERMDSTPDLEYVPERTAESWRNAVNGMASGGAQPWRLDARRAILAALHEGGVPVLLGTDSPQLFSVPGFSIHAEMQAMVDCGMTPFEVLSSATRHVATHLDESATRGTIAPGKVADLVLFDEDPLSDIAHTRSIAGVMVAGRWLDRAALDERLAAIAR